MKESSADYPLASGSLTSPARNADLTVSETARVANPWIVKKMTMGRWIICRQDGRGFHMERATQEGAERCRDEHNQLDADNVMRQAAPDMLAALKEMTERYCDLVDSGDCGNWESSKDAEVIRARAVIAKAEGRTS